MPFCKFLQVFYSIGLADLEVLSIFVVKLKSNYIIMKSKYLATAAMLCFISTVDVLAEDRTVWLDEIDSNGYYVQDWGRPEINRSVVGTPLSIGGQRFERGIGGHAISRMLFDLGGKARKIEGWAGPDDANLFATNLEFKIIGDDKELWDSGVMKRGDKA